MAYKKLKLWEKEKAAIYIRVSTTYQVDKDSLPLQRKMCISYCEMHGLEYEVFEDAGVSAKSEKRPAYQDMMKRFRTGEFSHLIVYKLDRISRNLLDFMGMYEELESLRVTFVSLNENFDTNSAMGKAMLAIMIIFAQMEREIDSERVLAVMIGRAENDRADINEGKGLWNGAHAPFGFYFDDEKNYPVPDDKELTTLHLIFDMYEELRSSLQIARYLNDHKVPSKRGGKWTSKVICDIIRNRFYIGEYSYNKRQSGHGPYKPKEEWVIRPNNHPGVISMDQFNRCNTIMDQNRNEKVKNCISHIHIFQGILKCHTCGGNTTCSKDKIRSNGIRPSAYSCSLRRTDLDNGCTNDSNPSDYVIGGFVFAFIVNYYKAYKNFKKISSHTDPLKKLSDTLLQGREFHGVSIEKDSLKNIFNTMMRSSSVREKIYFDTSKGDTKITSGQKNIIQYKKKELEKYNLALEKLTDLYLYGDNVIDKKEYLSKRHDLENKKSVLVQEIEESHLKYGLNEPENNIQIDSKELSAIFLNIGITDLNSRIRFADLYEIVDHSLLKKFISAIIKRIEYEFSQIYYIQFQNGLECVFEHAYKGSRKCPVCGGVLWNTVSCRRRTLPIQGKDYRRIRMGAAGDYYEDMDNEECEDCGVSRGRWHHYGCKKENCPICGKLLYQCQHGQNLDISSIKKI